MLERGTRLLGALGLIAILTACSSGPAKQSEPSPPDGSNAGPVVVDGGWHPVKGEPSKPAKVSGPGLFLVDAESGKSEFWPGLPGSYVYVNLSPDSRFVWSATTTESVLADRESGKSYRWSKGDRLLVGAHAASLLWEELIDGKQTGHFRLERLDGTPVTAFGLDLPTGGGDSAVPRLAQITSEGFVIYGSGEQNLLVDAETGARSEVARSDSDRLTHPETGNRYTAELYQKTIPVVTVFDAKGAPTYRVLSAYPSCGWTGVASPLWRADGQGLALWTGDGPIMADLSAGTIDSLATKDGDYWHDPAPSPTRTDRWGALGHTNEPLSLSSFGPGTTPVATGSIDWDRSGLSLDTHLPLWSADGQFLQFQAFLGGGKDFGCMTDLVGPPFLPPRMEKAPFGEVAVEVATPGDCLNLRAEPSKEARVITCLKDGTRLTFVAKPEGGNGPYVGYFPGWALVQTDGKALGWVSTEGGYLRWAL